MRPSLHQRGFLAQLANNNPTGRTDAKGVAPPPAVGYKLKQGRRHPGGNGVLVQDLTMSDEGPPPGRSPFHAVSECQATISSRGAG